MFALFESIKGAVYGALGAAAATALLMTYDKLIDDPAVAREARAGYVLIAEKTALEAQLAKERRLAIAAAQSLEEHRKRLAASQQAEALASDKLEAEIAENEALLEKSGRRCTADQSDVDFIMRP